MFGGKNADKSFIRLPRQYLPQYDGGKRVYAYGPREGYRPRF